MISLSLASRIVLAYIAANPGMLVPPVASLSTTTTTTTTTTDTPTTTDAIPAAANAAISDEVEIFYDASDDEDFSSIEVGRSAPPPTDNNNNNNDQGEEAFFNANDEFVGPSWWYDAVEEGGNDEGNDDGYFWSDDEGVVDPEASLYVEEQDLRAAVVASGDGDNDENALLPRRTDRPIAPLRRSARVARNHAGKVVPAPAQKAHLAAPDDLLASGCIKDVALERTVVSAGVTSPPDEVEPVVSADTTAPIVAIVGVTPITVAAVDPILASDPIPADPAVIDEDELMPLAGPISAPAIIVSPTADVSTDNCSLEDMDIDGPDFLDHNDDPMDVDWFAPCLAREFARILGLGGRCSAVSLGRSVPSCVANPRSSARLGVRSARFGARVAGKRVPSVCAAASRRLRVASGRK